VQHIVSNFLTFLFFLIPVVYPASAVPARFKFTMDLNPFAVFINSFHKILMDGTIPTWDNWIFMYTTSFLVLVLGNLIFTKYREQFAELL
jgi:ABC-type polysaccharide/polyol phosphate export permease